MTTIYHFENIDELLKYSGMTDFAATSYNAHLRDNYPDLHDHIMASTAFLGKCSIIERFHCYLNNITSRPKCIKCPNLVSFRKMTPFKYHAYCCGRCAMKDMPDKLGVENTSQLQTVKDAKEKTNLKKRGVTNPSKAKDVKAKISKNVSLGHAKRRNKLVESIQNEDLIDMPRKDYDRLVFAITEWMYKTYIDIVDPLKLRGDNFHLDHKVSRVYGFMNKVHPKIIGDITNLEILSAHDNIAKNLNNSIPISKLLEDYNTYYSVNELPPITDIIKKKTVVAQVEPNINSSIDKCKYCDGPANYLVGTSKTKCCSIHNTHCPAQKEKNRQSNKLASAKKKESKANLANDPLSILPS